MNDKQLQRNDNWAELKQFTEARIALGRAGNSIPMEASLAFKLAHAHARDAVHSVLDTERLMSEIQESGLPVIHVQSRASGRHEYLQRPDLGRLLNESSTISVSENAVGSDISIVLADGLSATAINLHGVAMVKVLDQKFRDMNYSLAPVCVAEQARVAVGDPIGFGLKARLSIILIGERPGLSAQDSMGAYITYQPLPGLTDESRNCVSNIRPQGLDIQEAATKIAWLVHESFRRQISGVMLKDLGGLLGDSVA